MGAKKWTISVSRFIKGSEGNAIRVIRDRRQVRDFTYLAGRGESWTGKGKAKRRKTAEVFIWSTDHQ
jgi:hypothetical protein